MRYIQYLELQGELKEGSNITFKLDDGTIYKGTVRLHSKRKSYYIEFRCHINDILFCDLDLDKDAFVRDIVGYRTEGEWPETKTLEELSKVLNALLKVNNPEVVKEKLIPPPGEWDWLLSLLVLFLA